MSGRGGCDDLVWLSQAAAGGLIFLLLLSGCGSPKTYRLLPDSELEIAVYQAGNLDRVVSQELGIPVITVETDRGRSWRRVSKSSWMWYDLSWNGMRQRREQDELERICA